MTQKEAIQSPYRTGALRPQFYMALMALCFLAACGAFPGQPLAVDPKLPKQPGEGRVYYVTDRVPRSSPEDGTTYSHARSASMAFGDVQLIFGETGKESQVSKVRIAGISESLRFPETPLPFAQRSGRVLTDAAAQAGYADAAEIFKAEVAQALRMSGQDEVVVFVHGYNNDFGEAVTSTANIWEATGRTVVPITYTWPAGNPGLLGYFKDRESGEFSIFHLKETLSLLAEVEGLNKIQLIAHSRGTDVATAALREMIIAARAAGKNPRQVLKIDNLILAAPDLDFGVVRQRMIAERFGPAFECITVYMNPNDGALGFAQALNSGIRFGRLQHEDLSEAERQSFLEIGNVYFVDVSGVVAGNAHSYFRENPVVLSDIVALLGTSATPDSPERNLTHIEANFWMLEQFRDIQFEEPNR